MGKGKTIFDADKNYNSEILIVSPDLLVEADWNYKEHGDEATLNKLKESIKRDGPGVLAVRILKTESGSVYEVIDGNHRLRIIKMLGYREVRIENFGEITLAEAVTIARRRNHQWFEDDFFSYVTLMNTKVFPEIKPEQLEEFMPESLFDLQSIMKIDIPEIKEDRTRVGLEHKQKDESFVKVEIRISHQVYRDLWGVWLQRLDLTEYESQQSKNARAFELALIEALNTPAESQQ